MLYHNRQVVIIPNFCHRRASISSNSTVRLSALRACQNWERYVLEHSCKMGCPRNEGEARSPKHLGDRIRHFAPLKCAKAKQITSWKRQAKSAMGRTTHRMTVLIAAICRPDSSWASAKTQSRADSNVRFAPLGTPTHASALGEAYFALARE
jgi:hypothetical protein